MMDTSHCVVCGQQSTLICSACRTVCYCSKQHQTSHWQEHKLNCPGKAYKIEEDVNTGHHLVASKNLEAGTFILQERPLLAVGIKPRKSEDKVCLGCYQKVVGRGVDCPGCKWPMCGKRECCGENSEHALGECALLKGARERLPANYQNLFELHFFYQGIFVLHFLSLKEKDPAKWRELMGLKHCVSAQKLMGLKRLAQNKIVPLVNNYLLSVSIPEEEIIKIITLLSANTSVLPESTTQYAYSIGCLFDHSCMANAEQTFTKSGKILVRSTLPIAKGSKITLNYSKNALLGTRKRLDSLVMTRFMGKCQCQRCCDPTELGTFTSGIFCGRCPRKKGILLPENPLEKESCWACNKCSAKKTAASIADFLESDVIQLAGRGREEALHPNHYVLTDFKTMLYSSSASELGSDNVIPNEEFSEIESEILKLLALADVISPGLSQLRGKLLYSLGLTEFGRLRHGIGITIMQDDALISKLKVLLETCREAYKILHWGPEETIENEHIFAAEMEKTIQQLNHFKETGVFDASIN